MKVAEECAQKALSLNPSEPKAYLLLCRISHARKDFDKAIEYAEKAVEVSPNDPFAFHFVAISMQYVGRFEEAIANEKKAMRLTPYYPAVWLNTLGRSSFHLKRYEDALSAGEKLLERCRKGEVPDWMGYFLMVLIYSEIGQDEKARGYAAELLKSNPRWNLEVTKTYSPYKNQADMDRVLNAARKVGLPEKPTESGRIDNAALPPPDKPSIAVLPFTNTGGTDQDLFCDGFTDQIITSLAKIPHLFIIASNSAFTYKGKPVKVQQVGRELGVKYVLEGSVRKAEDKVRITAQLVDATTENHLWAERYDRNLKDLFAVQDEVTMKIITSLQVKLTAGEYARILGKGTNNIEAYSKCLQAVRIHRRMTKEDLLLARRMFEEIIALDPNYPLPYLYLGFSHKSAVGNGWSKSPREDLSLAEEFARKAIELDESLGMPHRLLADIYALKKQWDKAIEEAERGFMSLFTHMTQGFFTDIDHPWGCPSWDCTRPLSCRQSRVL